MWYVYVLCSERSPGWHYYGFTHDLRSRYADHQAARVASTKQYLPLRLVYYEAYESEALARKREATLKKSRSATKALHSRITL